MLGVTRIRSFVRELQAALQSDISLRDRLALSDRIHDAECSGYRVGLREDRLWEELTILIENERKG